MDDLQARINELEAAVRDAASAVDAARAAGDRAAEITAIEAMAAANEARRQFLRSLRRDDDNRSLRFPNGW